MVIYFKYSCVYLYQHFLFSGFPPLTSEHYCTILQTFSLELDMTCDEMLGIVNVWELIMGHGFSIAWPLCLEQLLTRQSQNVAWGPKLLSEQAERVLLWFKFKSRALYYYSLQKQSLLILVKIPLYLFQEQYQVTPNDLFVHKEN